MAATMKAPATGICTTTILSKKQRIIIEDILSSNVRDSESTFTITIGKKIYRNLSREQILIIIREIINSSDAINASDIIDGIDFIFKTGITHSIGFGGIGADGTIINAINPIRIIEID